MALISPGVEVTIVDESNYVPAATNSVPFILLSTASNKISGTGTGVAPGTLDANANKVYLVTSQRDLAATFGNPFFYKTSAGTPINGYELNEYGLLAAFSVLGISNRAYIMRADVDLAQLTASLVRPEGAPAANTYWLDGSETSWGVFEWSSSTSGFSVKQPIVIDSALQLSAGVPLASIGSVGDYAVVITNANNPIYYKNSLNNWVLVGSDAWKLSWPTIQGTNVVTSALTAGNFLIINGTTITVPSAPNNTLAGFVAEINDNAPDGITARYVDSKFEIIADSDAVSDGSSAQGGVVNIDLLSSPDLLTALGITARTYFTPALQQSYNYTVPRWNVADAEPRPTGSVWNMLTAVNSGADIVVKKYDTTVGAFVTQSTPIYVNDQSANRALDPSGGGRNIPTGTLYVQYNSSSTEVSSTNLYNNTATFKVFERSQAGAMTIIGSVTNPTFVLNNTFTIRASSNTSGNLSAAVTVILNGTTAAAFVEAVSLAAVPFVSAAVTSTGAVSMTHSQGGVIVLEDGTGTPLTAAGFNNTISGVKEGTGDLTGALILSNWTELDYTASIEAPSLDPDNGRLWYYSATNQVDILMNDSGTWKGYRNVSLDVRGFNLDQTNLTGPLVSPTEPIAQSDGSDLVLGDLWIDTSNLDQYPLIYRWQTVSGVPQWVLIDNTDQTTSDGILFADARWGSNGLINPITDAFPSITELLTSNYLDVDAPDPSLYPDGMLLFNTRRSGFNVKRFAVDYFNARDFAFDSYNANISYATGDRVLYQGVLYVAVAPTTGNVPTDPTYWLPLETTTWVTAVGNKSDGSPYMGRLAQRQIVVQAMKSAIDTSDTLREEQLTFNLISTPNYPELMSNMVRLNNERSNTAFIVGDTPMRLAPSGNDIVSWATNNGGLGISTGDGLTISDPYLGVFYPACQTTDLTGSQVVQPSSHMMLRTIVRSDEVAFPWLAPAGIRRGVIDNAEAIGYIDAATGEFVTVATGQGLRDTLYENKINPITFIPGVGITNYGNKTESAVVSALDRINVARLVAFLRGRLTEIGKQFVFEPNDQITRNEITNAITSLMIDLVAKRGIYDYLVVCDLTNNTPARIDRNELYVDIAIEPVKAVEFIYIPVRIKNTGEIAAGNVASANAA